MAPDMGMVNLRALLSKPSKSPKPGAIPQSMDELHQAVKRRQYDRQTVFDILRKLDATEFKDDDEWMREFLNLDGNSTSDLADLLVDEKYDAPWIFRPDYLDTYFSRMGSGNESKMKLQYHSLGCPHGAANVGGDSARAQNIPNEDAAAVRRPTSGCTN